MDNQHTSGISGRDKPARKLMKNNTYVRHANAQRTSPSHRWSAVSQSQMWWRRTCDDTVGRVAIRIGTIDYSFINNTVKRQRVGQYVLEIIIPQGFSASNRTVAGFGQSQGKSQRTGLRA